MIFYCEQDCMVVLVRQIAPFPNNPKLNQVQSFNVKTDFDLQGGGLVWYARPGPQLFFNCTVTLCPTGDKGFSYSHKEVYLVYFSTFEPIELTRTV
jgi:hypothetical protein